MKEDKHKVCLLDFPESVLESILERLSPAELCRVSTVCNSLRIKCASDYLWKKHMKQKWGGLISSNAYQQSQFNDSIMSCYLSLESGRLRFPAQVYGRKNGGYALSCYNAQVSYDYKTDTFQARYSPDGLRTVEGNVPWDRLREPPPVDTSDCDLNILKPGDHIEILWSGREEDPCGWWYSVLGHLQSCDGNVKQCRCQYSDMFVLEFNQYSIGSQYRRVVLNKKNYRVQGNPRDGFYGGIRKLLSEEEITKWKTFWPVPQTLQGRLQYFT